MKDPLQTLTTAPYSTKSQDILKHNYINIFQLEGAVMQSRVQEREGLKWQRQNPTTTRPWKLGQNVHNLTIMAPSLCKWAESLSLWRISSFSDVKPINSSKINVTRVFLPLTQPAAHPVVKACKTLSFLFCFYMNRKWAYWTCYETKRVDPTISFLVCQHLSFSSS